MKYIVSLKFLKQTYFDSARRVEEKQRQIALPDILQRWHETFSKLHFSAVSERNLEEGGGKSSTWVGML